MKLLIDALDSILEMAMEKKIAENKVRGVSGPVILHLIKVLRWSPGQDYDKHIHDINSWLLDIQDIYLKGGRRKRLSAERYYQLLWDEPMGGNEVRLVQSKLKRQLRGYSGEVVMEPEDIAVALEKAYKELSADMAADEFDDIKDYL